MIVRQPAILSSHWMLIGRQEVTSHGGRIDLLAIAPDGSLVLIELKRDRTPREIVAQALDYASWVAAHSGAAEDCVSEESGVRDPTPIRIRDYRMLAQVILKTH